MKRAALSTRPTQRRMHVVAWAITAIALAFVFGCPDQITTTIDPDAEGRARVVAYTVIHSRDAAATVALVCDFDERRRALRVIEDPELAEEAMNSELCGREVLLGSAGRIRWF